MDMDKARQHGGQHRRAALPKFIPAARPFFSLTITAGRSPRGFSSPGFLRRTTAPAVFCDDGFSFGSDGDRRGRKRDASPAWPAPGGFALPHFAIHAGATGPASSLSDHRPAVPGRRPGRGRPAGPAAARRLAAGHRLKLRSCMRCIRDEKRCSDCEHYRLQGPQRARPYCNVSHGRVSIEDESAAVDCDRFSPIKPPSPRSE
jgi:hypothetical protein